MKKKSYFLILLLTFSSFLFAQGLKISVQDSLLSIKLQKNGIAAGRLGDFELALDNFERLYRLRQKMYGTNSIRLASPLINIGIQAFFQCYSLTAFTFPATLTTLSTSGGFNWLTDGGPFGFCINLTTVDMSACTLLTTIPQYCFESCFTLQSFVF